MPLVTNVTERYKHPSLTGHGRKKGQFLPSKTLAAVDSRTLAARAKITAAKLRFGSWRKVAAWIGDSSKATACNRLVKDKDFRPAITLIDMIEQATLPPLTVHVEICPDCGQVHTGRCYGKPIVEVAVLSSNERVVRAGKPRKRKPTKALRLPPELWERLNQERRAAGASWADYITSLAERGTNGEPASR